MMILERIVSCFQEVSCHKRALQMQWLLSVLVEKYSQGQKVLPCVFMELQKAYFRVPREELWYRKRKSRMAETCARTYAHLNSDVLIEKDGIINKVFMDAFLSLSRKELMGYCHHPTLQADLLKLLDEFESQ